MTSVVLDTHVVHWWSAEPRRLSPAATALLATADEIALAAISWFELAWLAQHGRIVLTVPIATWLGRIATQVRTLGVTPSIATAAVSLPPSFPGDPADRLIYASAVEHGYPLVTKDQRMREHPQPTIVTVW